jgi:hypothetical protein
MQHKKTNRLSFISETQPMLYQIKTTATDYGACDGIFRWSISTSRFFETFRESEHPDSSGLLTVDC